MNLMKFPYTINENNEVSIGSGIPVHVVYEELTCKSKEHCSDTTTHCEDSQDSAGKLEDAKCGEPKKDPELEDAKCGEPKKEDAECGEPKKEDAECGEPKKEENAEEQPEKEPGNDEDDKPSEDAKCGEPKEEDSKCTVIEENAAEHSDPVPLEEGVANEQTSNPTTFSDSERQELNQLRQEKKLRLIDDYKNKLTRETINSFAAKVDEYDYDKLREELDIEVSKRKNSVKVFKRFDLDKSQEGSGDLLTDLVLRYRK